MTPNHTAEECALLRASLKQAEAAYHQLLIGGGVREFTDQNGERIAYNAANAPRLLAYINSLRSQLCLPAFSGGGMWAPPAGVIL